MRTTDSEVILTAREASAIEFLMRCAEAKEADPWAETVAKFRDVDILDMQERIAEWNEGR